MAHQIDTTSNLTYRYPLTEAVRWLVGGLLVACYKQQVATSNLTYRYPLTEAQKLTGPRCYKPHTESFTTLPVVKRYRYPLTEAQKLTGPRCCYKPPACPLLQKSKTLTTSRKALHTMLTLCSLSRLGVTLRRCCFRRL
jgi:hypothetical protein